MQNFEKLQSLTEITCRIARHLCKHLNQILSALLFSLLQIFIRKFNYIIYCFFANHIRRKEAEGFVFNCSESTDNLLQNVLINENAPSIFILKACLYAVCDAFLSKINLSENTNNKKSNTSLIVQYICDNHTKYITLKDISELLIFDTVLYE